MALSVLAHMPTAPPPERRTPRAPPSALATSAAERVRDGGRVDINTADADTLRILPGVGPAIARRIVEDREVNGSYQSLSELTRVRGIGPRTVARFARLAAALPGAEQQRHAEPGLQRESAGPATCGLEGHEPGPNVEPDGERARDQVVDPDERMNADIARR